jgi:L-alanine-DL-glutamate epimerase-like enolase superfamily enzyme
MLSPPPHPLPAGEGGERREPGEGSKRRVRSAVIPSAERITRRGFLAGAVATLGTASRGLSALAPAVLAASNPHDIRIKEVTFSFEDFRYRALYKFGGVPVDRATILNVNVVVESARGRSARGFGAMPLGNVWAFPSRTLPYHQTLGAMKALAGHIAGLTRAYDEPGHPIEINHALEPEYLKAAAELSRALKLDAPIPKLAVQVTASPFDAALHDAYGKAHMRNCYRTYGREFLKKDLSHFLNSQFKGERLDRYILKSPKRRLAVFHSIGGADPITEADLTSRLNDGLPETLPEWIEYNGLWNFKYKLDGNNLEWDIDRIVHVDRVVTETQMKRGVEHWRYCLDFNERCPDVEYLLECLRRVKELTPAGFERILYVEQPTARDLAANRSNTMHEAAKLRPVVIDESLTDLESLLLAREMGYTGAALKACKGQSQAMLMGAAGQKFGMFLCLQDLTCPGAALLHSASIGAPVPGADTNEANARQYVPAANQPWQTRFPGIFVIRDGRMDTSSLSGHGIGAV